MLCAGYIDVGTKTTKRLWVCQRNVLVVVSAANGHGADITLVGREVILALCPL